MFICDLCRKEIPSGTDFVKHKDKHVCLNCVNTCVEIVKNPKLKDKNVIFLNEYIELKEQKLI